jgi:hypothetical protein
MNQEAWLDSRKRRQPVTLSDDLTAPGGQDDSESEGRKALTK